MKRKSGFYIMGMLVWSVFIAGTRGDGVRVESTVPLSIHLGEKAPLSATISYQALGTDKTFNEISSSDPDYLVFLRRVLESLIAGEHDDIARLTYPEGQKVEKRLDHFEGVERSYAQLKLEDVHLKSIVFIEDSFYFICLAGDGKDARRLSYLIRKGGDGGYWWDLKEKEYRDVLPILSLAFKYKFLDAPQRSEAQHPIFNREMTITPIASHENYVSVKYNGVSFSNGVPPYSGDISGLLQFLGGVWSWEMHGTLDEVVNYYDKKSSENIKERYGKFDETVYKALKNQKKTEPGYTSMRLIYAITADPVTFIYYTYGDGKIMDEVLYKNDDGYQIILKDSFSDVRSLFRKFAKKDINGAKGQGKGSSRQGKPGVPGL